jgi:hypothetical protein
MPLQHNCEAFTPHIRLQDWIYTGKLNLGSCFVKSLFSSVIPRKRSPIRQFACESFIRASPCYLEFSKRKARFPGSCFSKPKLDFGKMAASSSFAPISTATLPSVSSKVVQGNWDNISQFVQSYAEMLNSNGGELVVSHSAKGCKKPDHFHLDVIQELKNGVWCNLEIDYAIGPSAGGHSGGPSSTQHRVFYAPDLDKVSFKVPPLPIYGLVAIAKNPPWTRAGDQKSARPFPEWFKDLVTKCADVEHLLPFQTQNLPTHRLDHITALVFAQEGPETDFKLPNQSEADFNVNLVRTYLLESLLNAPASTRRLLFGIEDQTKVPVGCYLGCAPDFAKITATLMTGLDSSIFPTLRPEWFEIVYYDTTCDPSKWGDEYFELEDPWPLKSLPIALAIAHPEIACYPIAGNEDFVHLLVSKRLRTQLQSRFDANSFKFGSFTQAEVKNAWKALAKGAWNSLSSTDQLGNIIPLYVIEIWLKESRYSGAFFRTTDSPQSLSSASKLRMCFPYCPSSSPQLSICSLDPLAVWLRAQATVPFDPRLQGIFSSALFLKIFLGDNQEDHDNLNFSCMHYLQHEFRIQNSFNLFTSQALPPGRTTGQVNFTSRFHRVIIAKLDHAELIEAAAFSTSLQEWNFILVVDPSIAQCRERIAQCLSKLGSHRLLAVKALIPSQEPQMSQTVPTSPFSVSLPQSATISSPYPQSNIARHI